MKHFPFAIICFFVSLVSAGQINRFDSLWADPAIENRITKGIEENRKGDFTVQFPSLKGKAEIEIQQIKHEFQFGCNIFMLKGFKEENQNKRYEEVFVSLFNQDLLVRQCIHFYIASIHLQ